jgi:hypothetical protein
LAYYERTIKEIFSYPRSINTIVTKTGNNRIQNPLKEIEKQI